jgi:alkyl hydroperoxide reductase subunit AhpC
MTPLWLVLFFVTHDCPISNHYAPEIARICDSYASRGVACRIVYVDPTLTDAAARAHARAYALDAYPIIVDRDHRLVRETGVEIAPEAAIVAAGGRIAFRGRIDDFFVAWGQSRRQPHTRDLRDALDALLAGKPVAQRDNRPVGCIISDLRLR